MVRYSWESWRLWWTSSLAWTESTAWSMSLYSPYTLSLASKTITQSTGGFRKRDLNKKKLEKIFSWTGAGLFIATQLTPLPSSWDSVSGQTISSLLLSGQITSYNDPTNKKWKDISQINNQIQNLVIFFYKPTRFVFFKYPIETHNRYPTQNEKEALFTKLLG